MLIEELVLVSHGRMVLATGESVVAAIGDARTANVGVVDS